MNMPRLEGGKETKIAIRKKEKYNKVLADYIMNSALSGTVFYQGSEFAWCFKDYKYQDTRAKKHVFLGFGLKSLQHYSIFFLF